MIFCLLALWIPSPRVYCMLNSEQQAMMLMHYTLTSELYFLGYNNLKERNIRKSESSDSLGICDSCLLSRPMFVIEAAGEVITKSK